MNPMQSAIKGKRMMGKEMPQEEAPPDQAGGQELDLESLVAALSPEQKTELMGLIQESDQDPMAVEKGEPTSEETGKIEAQMSDDGGEGADEPASEDSDEIAMGMLDNRQKSGGGMDAKPRNLGERMRQGLATQLKAKGKIK